MSATTAAAIPSVPEKLEPLATLETNDGFRIHFPKKAAEISRTLKDMMNPPEGFESSDMQSFQNQSGFLLLWAARYMIYKNNRPLTELRQFPISPKVALSLIHVAMFLDI